MLAWNIDPYAVINRKLALESGCYCDSIVRTIVSSLHFYSPFPLQAME